MCIYIYIHTYYTSSCRGDLDVDSVGSHGKVWDVILLRPPTEDYYYYYD